MLKGQEPPVIHLIDDDESVRKSLSRLLRSADFTIKTYESANAWLDRTDRSEPDCIILDVRMPGFDGPSLHTRLLNQGGPPISVIFLSGHGSIPMATKEIKQGAVDFLTKPVDEKNLLAAIDAAIITRLEMVEEYRRVEEARYSLNSLTPREMEVLRYLISGLRNKQIAAELGIAEKTIKVHRGRIVEKLAIRSLVELVNLCRIAGVTPLD